MQRWPSRAIGGALAGLALALALVLSAPAGAEEEPADAPPPPPSTDATLSALTLSAGELMPAFASDLLDYAAAVDHDIETLAVTATPADPGATLTIAGVTPAGGGSVDVDLAVGETAIAIVVTAEDGVTTATTTVTVTRAAAEPPPAPPDPAGPPLFAAVYNGDFELDEALTGWDRRGGALEATAGLAGARAARLSSDTTSTKWIDQPVGVTPGAWYEAEALLAPDDGVDATWVRIAWYASADGSGSQLATVDSESLSPGAGAGAGATLVATGAVQAPDGAASARVRAVLRPAGTEPAELVVDNVAFAEVPAPAGDPPPDGDGDEAPSLPVDAVLNGDFEADDPLAEWSKHGGELSASAVDGDGHAATLTSTTTSTKWVDQVVSITPGRAYVLEAALSTDDGVDVAWVRLAWYASDDGGGSQIETADGEALAGGVAAVASVGPAVAPVDAATARVRIMLRPLSGAVAALTIDDVVLTVDAGGGTPDAGPPPEDGGASGPPLVEAIHNGDFEAAAPLDGWNAYGATLTATEDGAGSGSTAALLSSETASTKWLEQPLLINPGAWYEGSAWLASSVGIDAAWVRLAWYATLDASGEQLATVDSAPIAAGDTPGRRSTGRAQAPAGALSAKLRVMLRPAGEAPATVQVDDVTLTVAAPAPPGGLAPPPALWGAIYNGTFEADDPLSGWTAQRTEASFIDGEHGRSALVPSASTSTKWLEQLVNVTPGGWYVANAMLAPDVGAAAAWVRIAWYGPPDGSGPQLGTRDSPEIPGGVTTVVSTGPRQAPPDAFSARVRLMLRPHGEGEARLVADFVSLAPTVAPPPKPRKAKKPKAPPAPILWARLFNSNFTIDGKGDLHGWSKYGGTLELRRLALDDAWAAALVSDSASTKWLEQRIEVEAGAWYEASATVSPDALVASTWVRLSWYASEDGSGSQIASVDSPAIEVPVPVATDDVRVAAVASAEPVTITTGPVEAPEGARSARLKVMLRPVTADRAELLVHAADFAPAEPAPVAVDDDAAPADLDGEIAMQFEALANGDFEAEPALLAWDRHGGEADVGASTPAGGRAAGLRSESTSTKWLEQRVLVTPGGRYRVSGSLMPDRGVVAAWLRVAWYATPDASGSQIGAADSPALPGGASRPATLALEADAPLGARSARVRVMLRPRDGAPATLLLDDLSLTRIANVSRDPGDDGGVDRPRRRSSARTRAYALRLPPDQLAPDQALLRITELLPDPEQKGTDADYEWIEITNLGTSAAPLAGATLADNKGTLAFPDLTIPPGASLVIAGPAAVIGDALAYYPPGGFSNGLSNAGDHLELKAADGTRIDALSYGRDESFVADGIARAPAPGTGRSLVRTFDAAGVLVSAETSGEPTPGSVAPLVEENAIPEAEAGVPAAADAAGSADRGLAIVRVLPDETGPLPLVVLDAGATPAPEAVMRVGAGATNRTAWLVIAGVAVAALGAAVGRRIVLARGASSGGREPSDGGGP